VIPTPTVAINVAKISQSWSGPYDFASRRSCYYRRRGSCPPAPAPRSPARSPPLALVGPAAHLAIDLGGDDCPLPPAAAAGEPVADDGFRLAWLAAVAVGGVEEGDPLLMGNVHVRWRASDLTSGWIESREPGEL
jgi:hypothetical protein